MIRLYGKGAHVIHHGKAEYRATGGVFTVPPELVDRVRALGYSTQPPIDVEESVEVPAPAAPTEPPKKRK